MCLDVKSGPWKSKYPKTVFKVLMKYGEGFFSVFQKFEYQKGGTYEIKWTERDIRLQHAGVVEDGFHSFNDLNTAIKDRDAWDNYWLSDYVVAKFEIPPNTRYYYGKGEFGKEVASEAIKFIEEVKISELKFYEILTNGDIVCHC